MTNLSFVNLDDSTVEVEEFSKTEAALAHLREKYSTFPDPASSQEAYEEVKAGVKELTGYRTSLEAKRKEIKQPYLDAGKVIDSKAKEITAALVELEDPMKAAKKLVDDRKKREEEERLARLDKRVAEIRTYKDMARGLDSDGIADLIEKVEAIECDDFYDRKSEAIAARGETLDFLGNAYSERLEYERSERQRREEEEKRREVERKQGIQDRINKCRMIPLDCMGASVKDIESKLRQLKGMEITEQHFQEFTEEAKQAYADTVKKVEAILEQQRQLEAAHTPKQPEPEQQPEVTGVDMASGPDETVKKTRAGIPSFGQPETTEENTGENEPSDTGLAVQELVRLMGIDAALAGQFVDHVRLGNIPGMMWTGNN